MSRSQFPLSSGWQWKLSNANGNEHASKNTVLQDWQPASQFPSVIQLELLHTKQIPDPNIGENERLIQWVGEVDWVYRTSFPTPTHTGQNTELVFEGLDTFATVTLNGREILKSNNMFLPARIDIKHLLKRAGEENVVEIVFESALKKGTELEKQYGERASMMRDKRRMQMRKAQYHWGWDWGPIIVTCGPYLPIHLDTFDSRIDDLYITTNLAPDHTSAEITVNVKVGGTSTNTNTIVKICNAVGEIVAENTVQNGSSKFKISKPELWWPNGNGAQPLYTATATLSSSTHSLDTQSKKFGIRTITLIQRPLDNEPGTTFMFNVNGLDIFIQGGDWVPADNLTPRLTRQKYYDWMVMAKKGNLNMIRVWGGGIYEPEEFFDACDELGLLVWHDFAFACGDYPLREEYLESVKKEVEAQTLRMRGRASLALLCGGNEDFMLADYDGEPIPGTILHRKHYDHTDTVGPFENTEFPQRKIYLDVIPKIVKSLCNVQYWANSPWGGPEIANDPTIGDIHQWDVWHGKSLSYQNYKNLSGRFISEFGMHGFPDMRTVNEFAPNAIDRHPQSRAIDCHNKGHGAETRIARYLAENFRYSQDLEKYVYASQLMQSEAYGYACRDWKRKFGGKGKESCAGMVIWQFNDCYPCTSWSFVDYHIRPKPAYFTIKRAFADVSVGIERTPWSRWIDDDHPRSLIPKFTVWGQSNIKQTVTLVLKAYDMVASKYIEMPSREVTLLPNQTTELGDIEVPNLTEDSLIITSATLVGSKPLARMVNWPEPFRYLNWHKDTKVKVEVFGEKMEVSANYPVKGLLLSVDGAGEVEWEDNMLDLMPGETLSVGIKGLNGREIKKQFLNDWEL